MPQFFQPSYWLTFNPPQVNGAIGEIVFIVFIFMFVLGIISRIVAFHRTEDRYIQHIGSRIGVMLMTMGLLGTLLLFFGYERIQFFGGRFWYVVWLLGFLVWGLFLLRFITRDVPVMRESDFERAERSKYLPQRKNRKNRQRR